MVRDSILPTQPAPTGWARVGSHLQVTPHPTPPPPRWVLVVRGSPWLADVDWWVVLAGDIVDSSADSPPSLKARTHSVSTGGSPMGAGGGEDHTSPQGRGPHPHH